MTPKKDYKKLSLALHKKHKGKLAIVSKVKLNNKDDLSIAYTPGVAEVCTFIQNNKEAVYTHTLKANTVAVISDGSAVLGLGNIGPEAAIPVMEGKAVLFKKFANIDAFPICLNTQDVEEIIKTIKNIAPVFGGINLEDISAPRCFEIEERLKKELNIPVFHDDQHGTAIVVLSALINALKVVNKKINNVKIVVNGAGSAAIAISKLLIEAGIDSSKMIIVDSQDTLHKDRKDLNKYKLELTVITNKENIKGGLENAIKNADVFIGVSKADVLKTEWVKTMNEKPIVFAMANPNPEISFENAKKADIAVYGTGRSDYPNQINNVLAFPGIFRGALDHKVKQITDDMKIKAAYAIAGIISKKELKANYVIPKPFDKRVVGAVSKVVR
jgi:malate dehydrogenase (oxaloacetate-decarboxylating)